MEAAGLTDGVKKLPSLAWSTSEAVAAAGVGGLAAGRTVVIPGLLNRATALGGQLTPRRVLLPLLARFHPALGRH